MRCLKNVHPTVTVTQNVGKKSRLTQYHLVCTKIHNYLLSNNDYKPLSQVHEKVKGLLKMFLKTEAKICQVFQKVEPNMLWITSSPWIFVKEILKWHILKLYT